MKVIRLAVVLTVVLSQYSLPSTGLMLCFLSLQITKNVLKTSSKMPLQVEVKQVSTDRIGFSVRSFTSLRTADILLGFFLLYSFNGTGMASVTVSMDDAGLLCISILHLHYFFSYGDRPVATWARDIIHPLTSICPAIMTITTCQPCLLMLYEIHVYIHNSQNVTM